MSTKMAHGGSPGGNGNQVAGTKREKMSGPGMSPCAACKLLRRRCAKECVFAPYFPPDEPQKFANVHKVFGASNVNKMLQELPLQQRSDAVGSMVYEADSRVRDPVYGCVGLISALQQQVASLQQQLTAAQAEIVCMRMHQAAVASNIVSLKGMASNGGGGGAGAAVGAATGGVAAGGGNGGGGGGGSNSNNNSAAMAAAAAAAAASSHSSITSQHGHRSPHHHHGHHHGHGHQAQHQACPPQQPGPEQMHSSGMLMAMDTLDMGPQVMWA